MSVTSMLVSRIKVAISSKHLYCIIPYSKLAVKLLDQMIFTGYIYGYNYINVDSHLSIKIKLKYYHNKPLINHIKLLSKPSRKLYWTYKKLQNYLNSNKGSIILLSTNNGILNSDQALKLKIGGEVLIHYY